MITPKRKLTRQVKVRGIAIGGGAPVVIQSMTNTDACDIQATLAQIERLDHAGCRIMRLAVPSPKALKAFAAIRAQTDAPLVADIHFQSKLAVGAIEAGADKVRINPGNIGPEERVKTVVDAARAAGVPIRVGVNSGSVAAHLLKKHGGPTPRALLESALEYAALMERLDFDNLVFSIKASDALTAIEACRLFARDAEYPQHIGVTESGTARAGAIRSAVGLGTLLAEGIGDTIRVSLAGDPVEEIVVAKEILKTLGLAGGPIVLACPTCGRTRIDVAELAAKVESMTAGLNAPLKIAVMGCIVNGPGEARDADIGIAGGAGQGEIFVRGKSVAKVKEADLLDALWFHVTELLREREAR